MTGNLTPQTSVSPVPSSLYETAARLVVYLTLFEAGTALALFGHYKSPAMQWTTLGTLGGLMMAGGIAFMLTTVFLMVRASRNQGSRTRRMWLLACVTNLVVVLIATVLLESMFRVGARETDRGLWVMHVVVPYGESELFERSRRASGGNQPDPMFWRNTFFVHDKELGWTVGKSRITSDGMYASSEEGLRSQSPGVRLHDAKSQARVALLGDSNAFSLEVPYQESWAYYLQEVLGSTVQVLNFGVDGYGVDQMYLRYRRDVRPWHPDIVLVGFIEDDLWRTMVVYPFLSRAWPGFMVKPRFDDRPPIPELLNVPLPAPEEILSARTSQDLPYLIFDPWSARSRWASWIDQGPLVLRVLDMLVTHTDLLPTRFSNDAVAALNAHLFARMHKEMLEDGVTPIFVSLPGGDSTGALTRQTLDMARLPYIDMSTCITEIPEISRYVPSGRHFTGTANSAIAKCTSKDVLSVFGIPRL